MPRLIILLVPSTSRPPRIGLPHSVYFAFLFVEIHSADTTGIGRFDHAFLSDQSRIELLVSGFEDCSAYKDTDGEWRDICNLAPFLCDADGNVVSVKYYREDCGGRLDMRWLPAYLKRADFYGNKCHGTYDSALIPVGVRFLRIAHNRISGSVALSELPNEIRFLDLSRNDLSGALDFTALPGSLQSLNLMGNQLDGGIDLRRVTKHLVRDSPGTLLSLFWEDVETPELQSTLMLDLECNRFNGIILASHIALIEDGSIFDGNVCTQIVDVDGECRAILSSEI